VITLNGFDAYKEFFYPSETRAELLARGISLCSSTSRASAAIHAPDDS
jgi:hypothetical protein